MTNQQIADQLTSFIPYLEKPLKDGDANKLRYDLKRDYKKIVKLLFSDLKGSVNINSPRALYLITDDSKALCALDHHPVDPHEKMVIDMRQNYYDDITDDLNEQNRSLKDEAIVFIYLLKYISLDLTMQTKHHIYLTNDVNKGIENFSNENLKDYKYLMLKARVMSKSIAQNLNHDLKISTIIESADKNRAIMKAGQYCVITYIPIKNVTKSFVQLTKDAHHIFGLRQTIIKNYLVRDYTKLLPDGRNKYIFETNPKITKPDILDRAYIEIIKYIPALELKKLVAFHVHEHDQHVMRHTLNLFKRNYVKDFGINALTFAIFLGLKFKFNYEHPESMFGATKKTRKVITYGIHRACKLLINKEGSKVANATIKMLKKNVIDQGISKI